MNVGTGGSRARKRLTKYVDEPFTYAEVGATDHDLPPGYDHLHEVGMLGTGRERFDAAAASVLHWAMQRGTGLGVRTTSERAEPGAIVVIGRGPVRAPCRVVYVVNEPDRRGFAYGTLPGHPESGEELFTVRYQPSTEAVYAEVVAFSRPARWWSKAAAPAMKVAVRILTRRYIRAVQRDRTA